MKKLLSVLIVLLALSVSMEAQHTEYLKADSISNSQTEYDYINLDKWAPFDSICVNIYASGEIDLDSLDIQGGVFLATYDYKGTTVSNFSVYEALEGATLTVNNDSAAATYVQRAATITKQEAAGYNRLKVSVTAASSGNDATDSGQKYIILYTVYKP